MNKLLLALSTASLLALTACGGGGGDDAPVQPIQPTNPTAGNGGSTTGGSTTGGSTTGGSTTGGSTTGGSTTGGSTTTASKAYEPAQYSRWTTPSQAEGNAAISAGKRPSATFKSASNTASRDTAQKFNTLSVNGKEIEIYPTSGVTLNVSKIYSTDSGGVQLVVGGNSGKNGTAYARYGFVNDKNNRIATVFYQGVPTANMPKAGSATYKGHAVAMLPATMDYATGDASFNVNFANKKLTGTLSNWQDMENNPNTTLKNVAISSTISGNTFKGSNNQGKFYGTNAQNLAGSFADKTQKIQGAFGANKQ